MDSWCGGGVSVAWWHDKWVYHYFTKPTTSSWWQQLATILRKKGWVNLYKIQKAHGRAGVLAGRCQYTTSGYWHTVSVYSVKPTYINFYTLGPSFTPHASIWQSPSQKGMEQFETMALCMLPEKCGGWNVTLIKRLHPFMQADGHTTSKLQHAGYRYSRIKKKWGGRAAPCCCS